MYCTRQVLSLVAASGDKVVRGVGLSVLVLCSALTLGGCPFDLSPIPRTPPGGRVSDATTNARPQLQFVRPTYDLKVRVGSTVQIGWIDSDSDDNATVEIYYDTDGLAGTGDEVLLVQTDEDTDGADGVDVFMWDTTGLSPGVYYILGIIDDGVNPAVTVYASHTIELLPPVAPSLSFVSPVGNLVGVSVVSIRWDDDDPDSNATVTIFYDLDQDPTSGNEQILVQRDEDPDGASDTYDWSLAGLPAGDYYVGGTIDDGEHPAVTVYANAVIEVPGPQIDLLDPSSDVEVDPGDNVVIRWQDEAPAANATITLFYDNDLDPGNGYAGQIAVVQEDPDGPGDTVIWNVPSLKAGRYYIGATIDDGISAPVTDYALGAVVVRGPSLRVLRPLSDVTLHSGGTVLITWEDECVDPAATIEVFYDRDGRPDTGDEVTLYATTVGPDDSGDTWSWAAPALQIGTYYIGVKLDDGVNDPVVAYAPGHVIEAGPLLNFTSPAGSVSVYGGDVVTISWQDEASGVNATIDIFYDNDTNFDNGISGDIAQQISEDPDGTADSVTWTVPGLKAGTYYIGGVISDGVNPPIVVYASGTVEVQAPQIVLQEPASDLTVIAGDTVTISWTDQAAGNAQITLFYDDDQDVSNGYVAAIATVDEDPDGPGNDDHAWSIDASVPEGDYYIGATLDDNVNAPVTVYAPGKVTVAGREYFTRDLGSVEAQDIGRTFLGFSPGGELGGVMAQVPWVRLDTDPKNPNRQRPQPGVDFNGDGYDDFMLIAPHGNSFYLERQKCGEAYLVHSDPVRLFSPPAVRDPDGMTKGSSDGITSCALSRDADGDGIPDLLFGLPYVENILQEEQDYDPWDQWEYDFMQNNSLLARHFWVNYPDHYRDPQTSNQRDPDGSQIERDESGWGTITAGMVVAVSGDNPPISAGSWPPQPNDIVIPLDNVGQISTDPHPLVVTSTAPFPADYGGGGGPRGLRFYAPWWLFGSDFQVPNYAEYPGIELSVMTPYDPSRFGKSLVEADLDGDGSPEWIVVQPYDESTGSADEGWIHIIWTQKSLLWDVQSVSSLPWQNGGDVKITPVTIDQNGNETSGSVQSSGPPPMDVRVYSWPYAFTRGDLRVELVTDQGQGGAQSYRNPDDQRTRWYCWPMVSDFISGDADDAPQASLGGLANVGDFNGDGREDFTVGAPNGSPGGRSGAGCVYLVFGRADFGDHNLGEIRSSGWGLAGIEIQGLNPGDQLGAAQATAGDFNGDGLMDWLIGAPGYDGGRGAVAVIYGSRDRVGSFTFDQIGTDTLPGVVFVGENAGDSAGKYVAGVGDVDGDGYDDILIAAPGADDPTGKNGDDCGVVYLIYGGPDFGNRDVNDPIDLSDAGTPALAAKLYVGPASGDQVGPVAPAGDVNGDGLADFLIGNPNRDRTSGQDLGEVYLIRGSAKKSP